MRVIDVQNPDGRAAGIEAAAAAIRDGKLVGLPTETVYGLAADATNGAAVAGIFAAKGRPRFNPLIIHVTSTAEAGELGELGELGARLAAAFWPGPLTLVLAKRAGSKIADLVTAGLDTIAIRVPAHPVATAVIRAVGRPLAAPSANRSGSPSATTAAHVVADLGEAVAVILDAGPAEAGIESTIVGIAGETATLLRPGVVPRAAIEAVLGVALLTPHGGRIAAPGMLASHYAPKVPLRLEALAVKPGESLLAFGDDVPAGARAVVNLSAKGDLVEAAANLFAALRALDAVGAPIAVVPIIDVGVGEAINDRLRRAAAPRG